MKKTFLLSCVALAAVSGYSISAMAQTPTCADVVWGENALVDNPGLRDNCLEVVQRGGAWYARMRAKVVRQGATSTVVRWQNTDGTWGASERTYPPRGFTANVDGKDVEISQLQPGQEVNVYLIDEGNFALPVLEAAAAPAAAPEPAPAPAAAPAEPAPVEEVVEEAPAAEEEAPAVLPSTAGQVNWLALAGLLLVLLAGAVHVIRTRD